MLSLMLLTSCGEYNKVLKSNDYSYKYEYAKKAFEQKKYGQVTTILTDLVTVFKGTDKAEESLYLLALAYYENQDYTSAGSYFKTYYTHYPKGQYAELARYYAGYGYSTEVVFSADYEGAEGKEKMKAIMASMRSLKKGDTLVNRKIASVEDLLGENTGFPKADVIIIRFETGEKLVVRPSGTEPKIKYYLFLSEGKDGRKALEAKVGQIKEEFQKAL